MLEAGGELADVTYGRPNIKGIVAAARTAAVGVTQVRSFDPGACRSL